MKLNLFATAAATALLLSVSACSTYDPAAQHAEIKAKMATEGAAVYKAEMARSDAEKAAGEALLQHRDEVCAAAARGEKIDWQSESVWTLSHCNTERYGVALAAESAKVDYAAFTPEKLMDAAKALPVKVVYLDWTKLHPSNAQDEVDRQADRHVDKSVWSAGYNSDRSNANLIPAQGICIIHLHGGAGSATLAHELGHCANDEYAVAGASRSAPPATGSQSYWRMRVVEEALADRFAALVLPRAIVSIPMLASDTGTSHGSFDGSESSLTMSEVFRGDMPSEARKADPAVAVYHHPALMVSSARPMGMAEARVQAARDVRAWLISKEGKQTLFDAGGAL